MKHTKRITLKPTKMQDIIGAGSNFEAWKNFLVKLTDQIIEFAFIMTRNKY
ncbi:MAG: hypothetical protein N3G21_07605 [Candidatus Hydrogenedentes bacterium]|nr:hypothetical protein [Candidatus Hydrogenedentota bacterium]